MGLQTTVGHWTMADQMPGKITTLVGCYRYIRPNFSSLGKMFMLRWIKKC